MITKAKSALLRRVWLSGGLCGGRQNERIAVAVPVTVPI